MHQWEVLACPQIPTAFIKLNKINNSHLNNEYYHSALFRCQRKSLGLDTGAYEQPLVALSRERTKDMISHLKLPDNLKY